MFIKNPVAEFEFSLDQCLKLLRALYGLCDVGDLWHTTLDEHYRLDLGMAPFRADPALYYLLTDGKSRRMSESHVDELLRCGDNKFGRLCRGTSKRFELKQGSKFLFALTGFVLDKDN